MLVNQVDVVHLDFEHMLSTVQILTQFALVEIALVPLFLEVRSNDFVLYATSYSLHLRQLLNYKILSHKVLRMSISEKIV